MDEFGEEYYQKKKVDVLFKKGVTQKEAHSLIDENEYVITSSSWDEKSGFMRLEVPKGEEYDAVELLNGHEYVENASRELSRYGLRKLISEVIKEDYLNGE